MGNVFASGEPLPPPQVRRTLCPPAAPSGAPPLAFPTASLSFADQAHVRLLYTLRTCAAVGNCCRGDPRQKVHSNLRGELPPTTRVRSAVFASTLDAQRGTPTLDALDVLFPMQIPMPERPMTFVVHHTNQPNANHDPQTQDSLDVAMSPAEAYAKLHEWIDRLLSIRKKGANELE